MDLKIRYQRGFIKPDRKSILILVFIILLAVLVGMSLFNYFSKEPEITIQEQSGEPDKLMSKKEPLTEEEIQNQVEDIEKPEKPSQVLTEEEIKELEGLYDF